MLDSRNLRLFLMLADELHFGRAAERLEVARSVLSLHVKRLYEVEVRRNVISTPLQRTRFGEVGADEMLVRPYHAPVLPTGMAGPPLPWSSDGRTPR